MDLKYIFGLNIFMDIKYIYGLKYIFVKNIHSIEKIVG